MAGDGAGAYEWGVPVGRGLFGPQRTGGGTPAGLCLLPPMVSCALDDARVEFWTAVKWMARARRMQVGSIGTFGSVLNDLFS